MSAYVWLRVRTCLETRPDHLRSQTDNRRTLSSLRVNLYEEIRTSTKYLQHFSNIGELYNRCILLQLKTKISRSYITCPGDEVQTGSSTSGKISSGSITANGRENSEKKRRNKEVLKFLACCIQIIYFRKSKKDFSFYD